MSDTPRTDSETRHAFVWDVRRGFRPSGIVVSVDLARTLERELADAEEKIKHLESKFTKLDKPMYSGNPMLDSVLETSNPEFDAWVKSQSPTYWARYDLSAARIGWEAAMTKQKGTTP